jgi:hypothetical protein
MTFFVQHLTDLIRKKTHRQDTRAPGFNLIDKRTVITSNITISIKGLNI